MGSVRTMAAVAALGAMIAAGCEDPTQDDPPASPDLIVIAVVDPDLSDPSNPVPARLLWFSTRSGTARFLADYGEICDRAAVSGGELVTTSIEPTRLVPQINDVEIRFAPLRGGDEIMERVEIFVDAECTWPSHCPGDPNCVDFSCQ